nr:hypothetical protein GCM10020093_068770 [Planobispora longispora]
MAITCADGRLPAMPAPTTATSGPTGPTSPVRPADPRYESPVRVLAASPAEPPTRIRNDVPALIVGASGDPKTPIRASGRCAGP